MINILHLVCNYKFHIRFHLDPSAKVMKTQDEKSILIEFDSEDLLITGQWYWRKINQMDHWSIIGHFGSDEKKQRGFSIIKNHLALLKTLQ